MASPGDPNPREHERHRPAREPSDWGWYLLMAICGVVVIGAIVTVFGGFVWFQRMRAEQMMAQEMARAEAEMRAALVRKQAAELELAAAAQKQKAAEFAAREKDQRLANLTKEEREAALQALATVKEKGLAQCAPEIIDLARRVDPEFIAAEEAKLRRQDKDEAK
jgi:hypothetical protein